jgi:hypothetical protein
MTHDLAWHFNHAGHGSEQAFGALQLNDVLTGECDFSTGDKN